MSDAQEEDTIQEPKKAKKIPKMLDGTFYELFGDVDANGNLNGKCTICNDIRKGNISSTGNFIKHYELKHPLRLNDLKLHSKMKKDTKQLDQPTINKAIAKMLGPDDVCNS